MSSGKKGKKGQNMTAAALAERARQEAEEAALPQPSSPQEIQEVISMLLSSDNNAITQGTKIMSVFMKKKSSVIPMMQQVVSSPITECRQYCALLLRQNIAKHWKKLPDDLQHMIKTTLLERLSAETQRPAMLSVTALVAAVATLSVPFNKWNELLSFLLEWCKSDDINKREISMILFRALAEKIGASLKPHYRQLQEIFARGLTDPHSNVRVQALYAIGVLVDIVPEEEVRTFKALIPNIVELAKMHLVSEDESALSCVFEVLDTLSQAPVPILETHTPILLSMMIEVAANTSIERNIREQSTGFMSSLIEHKPKTVVKTAGLVERLVQVSIALLTEPDDEVFESDEFTPQRMGVEVLQALVTHLPKNIIFTPVLTLAAQLTQSSNKHERKAGLVILACISDSCAQQISDRLQELIPVVCKYLGDPEYIVRAAASLALTEFADCVPEAIAEYHQMIIPNALAVLDNPSESLVVKQKNVTAVEVMCDSMEDGVTPYLEDIFKRVITPLSQLPHDATELKYHEGCISVIRALAEATGASFAPYYKMGLQVCGRYLLLKEDETLTLRCRATDAIGCIFGAVARDPKKKLEIAEEMLQCFKVVVTGMDLDYFELRDSSYHFFLQIATALEADFKPLAQTVMMFIIATCQTDDGVEFTRRSEAMDGYGSMTDSEAEEETEENLEHELKRMEFKIRAGALDEKVSALACLSVIITAIGADVELYMKHIMQIIEELVEYPHEFIRGATIHVIHSLFKMFQQAYPNEEEPKKGEYRPLRPHIQEVVDKLLGYLLGVMKDDTDKGVVSSACECMTEALKLFGLGLIKKCHLELYQNIRKFLKEKAPCQRPDEDEDDSAQQDHDDVLIDSVTDLIGVLAAAGGAVFEPAFRDMMDPLLKYCAPSRHSYDRSMGIGCFAEVAQEFGPAIQPYLPKLLPVVLRGLCDSSVGVRRNSAFCYGCLVLYSGSEVVLSKIGEVYPLLRAMYSPELAQQAAATLGSAVSEARSLRDDEFLGCRDNACSAIAKMIAVAPTRLPLEEALDLVLQGLPLSGDYQECKYVYPWIMAMYSNPEMAPIIGKHTKRVIEIFADVLGHPEVDTGVQKQAIEFVNWLSTQVPSDQFESMVNALKPSERERFIQFLRSARV